MAVFHSSLCSSFPALPFSFFFHFGLQRSFLLVSSLSNVALFMFHRGRDNCLARCRHSRGEDDRLGNFHEMFNG